MNINEEFDGGNLVAIFESTLVVAFANSAPPQLLYNQILTNLEQIDEPNVSDSGTVC